MDRLSGWLLAVLRKRMDVLDRRITEKNRMSDKYRHVVEIRDQLCQMLSSEQFQMLADWEASLNERLTEEREEWYLSGLSDGVGLSMTMDDLNGLLPGQKR